MPDNTETVNAQESTSTPQEEVAKHGTYTVAKIDEVYYCRPVEWRIELAWAGSYVEDRAGISYLSFFTNGAENVTSNHKLVDADPEHGKPFKYIEFDLTTIDGRARKGIVYSSTEDMSLGLFKREIATSYEYYTEHASTCVWVIEFDYWFPLDKIEWSNWTYTYSYRRYPNHFKGCKVRFNNSKNTYDVTFDEDTNFSAINIIKSIVDEVPLFGQFPQTSSSATSSSTPGA